MIIAEQIATYLSNQDILLYDPTSSINEIYVNEIPSERDGFLSIVSTGGEESINVDEYLTAGIQLFYRGTNESLESFIKIQECFLALRGFYGNFVEGENEIVRCITYQGSPQEVSEFKGNQEYIINYIVEYKI
jgi:hypothetical protein